MDSDSEELREVAKRLSIKKCVLIIFFTVFRTVKSKNLEENVGDRPWRCELLVSP
jgi:hypothetical protein